MTLVFRPISVHNNPPSAPMAASWHLHPRPRIFRVRLEVGWAHKTYMSATPAPARVLARLRQRWPRLMAAGSLFQGTANFPLSVMTVDSLYLARSRRRPEEVRPARFG